MISDNNKNPPAIEPSMEGTNEKTEGKIKGGT